MGAAFALELRFSAIAKRSWLAAAFLPLALSAQTPAVAPPSDPGAADPHVLPGKALFERNCAVCHGMGGTGGRGPNLARARLARAPDDVALQALIENGIPPEMPDGTFLTAEDIGYLVSYVRSLGNVAPEAIPGDATHGAVIFDRSGCAGCHIVAGHGTGYGPELTDESERRSAAYVREAILKPEAHLPAEFLMVKVTLPDGSTINGIRVNEDTFTLQMKDAAGAFHSFRKSDIKELQKLKGKSPMPPFEGALSDTDLQDLVAYLEAPRRER